jgi:hypothetical protein
MKVHSDQKILELKTLRQKGYSVDDLVKISAIPKSTIWHHVKNIKISEEYLSKLRSSRGGSRKRCELRWIEADKISKKLLSSLSSREKAITLAMLYWAEGSKKHCEFVNSDGRMIKLYLVLLKNLFNISLENITSTMRIFTGMKEKECLKYWSGITGIPQKKFIVRLNDGCSSGRTRYGMCRITVKKGGNILKTVISLINNKLSEN